MKIGDEPGSLTTTIYHELTTTTIVSQGIRRTIRASESPQSGYILGRSGPARTHRCGCKVLLISRFQVRVLGGSLSLFPANAGKSAITPTIRDCARLNTAERTEAPIYWHDYACHKACSR
jgi:hypothetical protein